MKKTEIFICNEQTDKNDIEATLLFKTEEEILKLGKHNREIRDFVLDTIKKGRDTLLYVKLHDGSISLRVYAKKFEEYNKKEEEEKNWKSSFVKHHN